MKITFISTPRKAMGWPCFHCGKPLSLCSNEGGKGKKPCCKKCGKNGKLSH